MKYTPEPCEFGIRSQYEFGTKSNFVQDILYEWHSNRVQGREATGHGIISKNSPQGLQILNDMNRFGFLYDFQQTNGKRIECRLRKLPISDI